MSEQTECEHPLAEFDLFKSIRIVFLRIDCPMCNYEGTINFKWLLDHIERMQ
jgi:hypothetical protein